MSDCCSKQNAKDTFACPECDTDCAPVKLRTLYHQIRYPENQEVIPDNYYFCPDKDCATAYFSSNGINLGKSLLLTQQSVQNNMLCYCFDISSASYLAALHKHEADQIKNFVIQRTKSAECACEIRNPSGKCCLANFKQLENELTTTLIKRGLSST